MRLEGLYHETVPLTKHLSFPRLARGLSLSSSSIITEVNLMHVNLRHGKPGKFQFCAP